MTKKERMFLIICVCAFVVCFVFISHIEHNYSIKGTVYEVENGSVVFEDITGNLWEIKTEGCKFYVNDNVVLYFNDNCTNSDRIDDKITNVKVLTNED